MENAQQVLGYSSLYQLRNFIQAMGAERASAGIVNALVGLGHGLELTIAADGVEAADQEAALVRSGCEQGQGQFFSGPIRASEIAGLFGSEATASLRLLVGPSYARTGGSIIKVVGRVGIEPTTN